MIHFQFFFLNLRGAIVSAEGAVCSLSDTYIAYNGIYIPFAVALALLNRISVKVTREIRKCFYFSCFLPQPVCKKIDQAIGLACLATPCCFGTFWAVCGGGILTTASVLSD